jgi:hypothetical protein
MNEPLDLSTHETAYASGVVGARRRKRRAHSAGWLLGVN